MEGCSVQPNQYETKDGKEETRFPVQAVSQVRSNRSCPQIPVPRVRPQVRDRAEEGHSQGSQGANGGHQRPSRCRGNEAAATIRNLGGLEKVKQLVAQAKEAQEAIDRLGGIEDAEATVEALEMLKGL